MADDDDLVSRTTDGLFVSGFVPAFPQDVDAVLCLCLPSEMELARPYYPAPLAAGRVIDYVWRGFPDDFRDVPSLDWLDATVDIVGAWRDADKTVLVHCAAGISRSPTVAAAYLMKKYHWSAAEALHTVRTARPVIDPNPGLLELLDRYEQHRSAA